MIKLMNKKSKGLKITILVLIPIFIAAIVILHYFTSRTIFTTSYNVGNSAGNLYNGGLFCEHNGVIYFSNPKDNHSLYSMTRAGLEVTKISEDTASYINADDNYVYYTRDNSNSNTAFSFLHVQTNSLCRVKHNGKQLIVLESDLSIYATQVGDYLYYMHYDKETASTLYQIKIDGSERKMVTKQPIIPASKKDRFLYYNGVKEDHNIYKKDALSGTTSTVYTGNCYNPIIEGEYAYFMDCDNNYSLAKVNLSTGDKTMITNDRIDCYNLYGNWIYYQRNGDSPALCRIQTDGSNQEEVYAGIYTNINITSSYVYFTELDDDTTYYQTPTIGAIKVSIFQP